MMRRRMMVFVLMITCLISGMATAEETGEVASSNDAADVSGQKGEGAETSDTPADSEAVTEEKGETSDASGATEVETVSTPAEAPAAKADAAAEPASSEGNAASDTPVQSGPEDVAETAAQPVETPPPPPAPRVRRRSGMGLRIAGYVLIGLGAANLLGSFIYFIPEVEDAVDDTYGDGFAKVWRTTWMAISGTMLSVGIPLAVIGNIKKHRAVAKGGLERVPALTGRFAMSRDGRAGYASLQLNF